MAEAIVRNKGEGERMWFLGGGTHTWKALSEETDNSMLVFEDDLERGKVTPMHFHADVDEALYVIEGEILLNVEGNEHVVGAGGFTFAPRGCAHAFIVTSEHARLLGIQTPGSGQAFYRDASEPATDGHRTGRLRPPPRVAIRPAPRRSSVHRRSRCRRH